MPADQPEFYDVCIIGGGIAGCIVARDVASTGNLRSVILECDASVGGVWAHNDYQGLRLHGLAAPYRSWSVAPPWQKGGGSEDNLYRPTKAEILEYIHSLVDHESIVVKTKSEYVEHFDIRHTGREDDSESRETLYEVNFQNLSTGQKESLSAQVVVFATGAVSTLGGEPNLPINPTQVTNGAHVIHSSQMSSLDETTLKQVENIYVVGSSKAAIDVLHHFLSNEQQHNLVAKTRWAHRGHILFTNRESMEGWVISPNPICQRARSMLFRVASWLCYHQMFDPLALVLGASRDVTAIGSPLAKVPYRGGVENKGVLDSIRSVFSSQLLLKDQNKNSSHGNRKSIVVNSEGILELHAQDGERIEVKQNDLVIFCTGQRRKHAGSSWQLDPSFNSAGIFTVHSYCQITPVSAVLTVGLIISYLDGTNETIYSSGYLAKQLCRIKEQLDLAKDKSSWAMTMSYIGGVFIHIQPALTPIIMGDLSFDHRWQSDWFGKDLDVRMDLLPIVTIPTRTMRGGMQRLLCRCFDSSES